jgi:hypothetical protein
MSVAFGGTFYLFFLGQSKKKYISLKILPSRNSPTPNMGTQVGACVIVDLSFLEPTQAPVPRVGVATATCSTPPSRRQLEAPPQRPSRRQLEAPPQRPSRRQQGTTVRASPRRPPYPCLKSSNVYKSLQYARSVRGAPHRQQHTVSWVDFSDSPLATIRKVPIETGNRLKNLATYRKKSYKGRNGRVLATNRLQSKLLEEIHRLKGILCAENVEAVAKEIDIIRKK